MKPIRANRRVKREGPSARDWSAAKEKGFRPWKVHGTDDAGRHYLLEYGYKPVEEHLAPRELRAKLSEHPEFVPMKQLAAEARQTLGLSGTDSVDFLFFGNQFFLRVSEGKPKTSGWREQQFFAVENPRTVNALKLLMGRPLIGMGHEKIR
ncbi:MAG: hypothetical protein NT067_00270 [Candidatus Diapherotrites archaeon]|nr:hypothetical protein [Candidatus Diapherotrites archaeon]